MCEAVAVSVGDDRPLRSRDAEVEHAEHDLFEDRSLSTPK
jgi:hypothetical protein